MASKPGQGQPPDISEEMNRVELTLASADARSKRSAVKWLHDLLLKEGARSDLGRRAFRLMLAFARDLNPGVRAEAMSRLPRAPESINTLMKGLADRSPEVRRASVLSLSWYWTDAAVHEALLRAIGDRDNMVRLAAATALSKQWEARVIALLIKEADPDWARIEDQWVSESVLPQVQGYEFDIRQLQDLVHVRETGDPLARREAWAIVGRLREPRRIGALLGGSGTHPLEILRIIEGTEDMSAARASLLKALLLYPYGLVGYVSSRGLDYLGLRSISEPYREAYSSRPNIESLKRSEELDEQVREILSSPDFVYGGREEVNRRVDSVRPLWETLSFDFPRYRSWMEAVDNSLLDALTRSYVEIGGMLTQIQADTRLSHPHTSEFISRVLDRATREEAEPPEAPPASQSLAEDTRLTEPLESIQPSAQTPAVPEGEIAHVPSVLAPAPREVQVASPTLVAEQSKVEESRKHYAMGTSLFDKAEYESAISEFQAALAADPKFARAHVMIGQIMEIQGNGAAAEAAYRESIAVDPELAEARQKLARILVARGEIAEPTGQLRQAVLLNPTDWRLRVELDRLLVRDRKFDEALADLRNILTNRPEISEAHGLSGIVRFHYGEFAEAQAELEAAIRYRPEDMTDMSTYHFFLALIKDQMGDRNGAIKDLKSALYYDPENSMARSELHIVTGRTLVSQGRTEEAKNAFIAAIDCESAYAEMRGAPRDLQALAESEPPGRGRTSSSPFEEP